MSATSSNGSSIKTDGIRCSSFIKNKSGPPRQCNNTIKNVQYYYGGDTRYPLCFTHRESTTIVSESESQQMSNIYNKPLYQCQRYTKLSLRCKNISSDPNFIYCKVHQSPQSNGSNQLKQLNQSAEDEMVSNIIKQIQQTDPGDEDKIRNIYSSISEYFKYLQYVEQRKQITDKEQVQPQVQVQAQPQVQPQPQPQPQPQAQQQEQPQVHLQAHPQPQPQAQQQEQPQVQQEQQQAQQQEQKELNQRQRPKFRSLRPLVREAVKIDAN